MVQAKKRYRLRHDVRGHWMPNPDFVQDRSEPEESHILAEPGSICELTDSQYQSFSAKFVPVDNEATDIRDAEINKMELAKIDAAMTGQPVNPNVPRVQTPSDNDGNDGLIPTPPPSRRGPNIPTTAK